MKGKIGIGMIILGIMMTAGSVVLTVYNRREETAAGLRAEELVLQAAAAVEAPLPEEILLSGETPDPDREMPTVRIDGNVCIGILSIPALELELPVLDGWNYDRLRTAPCRYAGSLYREDLVVMAHNYSGHFGKLNQLKPGDRVDFTDMEGLTVTFQVAAVEILEPGAVEEMTAGDGALTLFTCTYGGQSRVTVRCERTLN